MKIKSIYIHSFGGIKNFNLDLSDGLQVIYGENEAGKSTICEFVKAMFYGSKKTAGMTMSAREKYAPFDGSAPAGRITFEQNGREFVLERQFRKSDATDKITLTDTSVGETATVAADIGKELFGISLPAFERSVFIGNSPAFLKDENAQGELNQKLADTALAADDGVSYKKVLDRIDQSRLKLVSKSGKTGSLIGDIAECNRLTETLEETDRAARKKQEIITALGETDRKLKDTRQNYETVLKTLESAKDIENGQKLKEYLSLKEKLDTINRELTMPDGTVADEMFLKKFEFAFSKLENLRIKADSTEQDLKKLKKAAEDRAGASPDEIRERIAAEQENLNACRKKADTIKNETESLQNDIETLKNAAEKAESAKKRINLPLLIAGVIAIFAGVGIYIPFSSILLSSAVCAAGAILLLLSFILRPRDTAAKENAKRQADIKSAQLSGKQAELIAVNSEENSISAKIENLNIALNFGVSDEQRIKETEEKLNDEREAVITERAKALRFFSLPEDTDIDSLKSKVLSMSEKADEQKRIKLSLSYLSRDLGGISYEQAKAKIDNTDKNTDIDIEKQKSAQKELSDKILNLQTEKAKLETELKTGFRNMQDPEDLRKSINTLKEKITAEKEFYDAANTAYSVLEESFIVARRSFGSTLEKETLNNFKALTLGSYGALNISKDFDIRTERTDSFGMHETEYLSRGTKDQAYLALRLAVSKLISEKEPLPILLDDSLSQYDDKRFLAALKFLSDYAKDGQALLFTCHDFVVAAAEKDGIKTLSL